jgi:hypothetical protein
MGEEDVEDKEEDEEERRQTCVNAARISPGRVPPLAGTQPPQRRSTEGSLWWRGVVTAGEAPIGNKRNLRV